MFQRLQKFVAHLKRSSYALNIFAKIAILCYIYSRVIQLNIVRARHVFNYNFNSQEIKVK